MITDVNPFIYSHPIAPEDVIDRDEETKRLLTAAVGGHFVRLYAPRKYGKTSLLRRVLLDGERQERMIPILVDLYGVLSIADVAIRFERAYSRQLKGKVRARMREMTKRRMIAAVPKAGSRANERLKDLDQRGSTCFTGLHCGLANTFNLCARGVSLPGKRINKRMPV